MPNPAPLPEIEAEALKENSPFKALTFLQARLKDDPRSGARKLLAKFQKRAAREEKEQKRLESIWRYETEVLGKGFKALAGVDEAGRGPLAGPVVAAAVLAPPQGPLRGLDDSKKLTPQEREGLFPQIHQWALGVGVGQASVEEIDRHNIYRAAQLAMERAIQALPSPPDFLLTDAMPLPHFSAVAQKPLVHGDALSATIAAASIVAKVTRDRWMRDLHRQYPLYGFENHKGYGTQEHLRALEKHGACPEHRLTFGPVLETLSRKSPDGPLGYWREKLLSARDPRELKQVGVQIKRVALPGLSESQLEQLRRLFRDKRDSWESRKP